MESYLITSILLLVLTLLSAFFSGSETALFSIKKSDLYKYSHSLKKNEQELSRFMKNPQKILITILIGNLFVNLIASALSTSLLLKFFNDYGHFISIAIVTPVMIILCEISPKVISINAYEPVSKKALPLLKFFHKLFFPLRTLILLFTNILIKTLKLKLEHNKITEDELDHAVDMGQQEGVIEKEEGTLIRNVMRFSKKEAANIMFPRNRALFIPYGTPIKKTIKILNDSGVIRAPVYKKDLDNVVGVIDSRELLPYYFNYKKAKNINKLIRDIHFFPASRELNDLLQDFLREGIQIAIVVDEYGGTAGVVTLNAILAELMGKGFNKWEVDYKPEIRKLANKVSVISGEMQLVDFNFNFTESLDSTNSDTIGGYIIEQVAHFPKRGEEISTDKYILRVRYIRKNRIETVEVIQKDSEVQETGK